MKKRAAAPVLRRFAFIGSAIIHRLRRVRYVRAPAERAALIDRVKRVEDDQRTRQRHSGFHNAPAKAGQYFAFAAADQAGLGRPSGKLAEDRFVHNALLAVRMAGRWSW